MRQHYSLYPSTDHVVAAFKADLAPYEVNKGTIRFPLAEPIPVKLIEGIAKVRAKEVADRERVCRAYRARCSPRQLVQLLLCEALLLSIAGGVVASRSHMGPSLRPLPSSLGAFPVFTISRSISACSPGRA